jgi:cytochrome P450
MSRLHRRYGEIVSLARGTTKCVFVFSPEYNQEVLGNTALFHNLDTRTSPLRIPPDSALSRLFAGLTHMNGDRHRRQRQLVLPALQRKRVEAYYPDMVAVVEGKLGGWRAGQRRDFHREMRELTLAVAVKTLVGLDAGRGGDEMCRLLDRWMGLVFSLAAIALPFDLPGLPYRRLLSLSEELEGVILGLVERKRTTGAAQNDALSTFMQAHDEDGRQLTDSELVGQTNFLFMAGHATTASALTWSLFLLAQHPQVMSDVLDECAGKLRGETPTFEQLDELPYLEAALKETMRLLPPVLWWGRISAEPFTLGPYELPAGTLVIHSAYITHRISSRYPAPEKFWPERWLTAHPGPYEYIPFSAGPRRCLGPTFAMTEMKLVLAFLLQRYGLALPAKVKVDLGGLMLSSPRDGLPVVVQARRQGGARSEVRGDIKNYVDLN